MTARFLLPLLFLATVAFPAIGVEEKPNIVLIMADDVGYECFGAYGSEQYRTPVLDRLAAKGMRFDHCYSQPLCTPSRIKIMTGISNVKNYAGFSILRNDQKTIGQYLKGQGYRTMVGGKWQLLGAEHYSKEFRGKGSWPEKTGFDRVCLWQVDKLGDRYWKPKLYFDGENHDFGKDKYGPDIVVDHICDFMEKNQATGDPFFVYYPMILVHSPFPPTPDSESLKSKDKQKNFEDMVTYMDKLIGKMVVKTEALKIAENTLFLFTGDNGTHKSITSEFKGRTIRGGKGRTDDSGTREPLIAYWPGKVPAGKINNDLVDFSDFVPTLNELAGGGPIAGLDGVSFAPQLLGEKGNPRKHIFCYYNPRPERTKPVSFVRDKDWKLYRDGRFFHVSEDVQEKTSLSPETNAEVHARLKAAMDSMPAEGQMLLKFE